MSLFKSEYEFKISFEDLDPMWVVWHGNYIRYMEQARCDMLSKLNYTYTDMHKDNYAYPIAKMKVKYVKPAKFDEVLVMKSELLSVEPTMEIKYKLFNKETGEKLFEAKTMQIAIDTNLKQSVYKAPKGLINAIKEVDNEKV